MTQVVLIRPGATSYDEQHRIQGTLDVPLSPRGRSEVETLALRLADLDLSALYRGPGESVSETAEALGRVLNLRPKSLEQLRNLDQGLWQGLAVEEIKRRNPKVFRQWVEAPETICPPLGETIDDARERIEDVLRPLLKRHRGETFGLVAAEPIAQLVAGYLRQDPDLTLEELPETGVFERIEVAPELCRNGKP
jgi:broad specificity phosphatase PhoE